MISKTIGFRGTLFSDTPVFVYYKDFADPDPFGISKKKSARTSTSVESELAWAAVMIWGIKIGTPKWENGMVYPLVMTNIAIENGHL